MIMISSSDWDALGMLDAPPQSHQEGAMRIMRRKSSLKREILVVIGVQLLRARLPHDDCYPYYMIVTMDCFY